MKIHDKTLFKYSTLALCISSALLQSTSVSAQDVQSEEKQLNIITVTAARRPNPVQEAPLNITALDQDIMNDQNIGGLEDVARWVPGLTISEQGGRDGQAIIVRGLNTNSSERSSDAGTVATYLGEIPLNADIRLTDLQRIEVLIGPQGTLYGAGTLGGAIRYVLNEPDLSKTEVKISGDIFTLSESSGNGGEVGFMFNTPLIEDKLAFRTSLNYYDSTGYVDYNYVVKTPGVSLPDPWLSGEATADHLKAVKDVNDEQISTARLSLRWTPTERFDGTLNYYYQKQENGGNSTVQYNALNSANALAGELGQYDSGYRYEEPNEKIDTLLSLELKFDLGFAELVSATGYSTFERLGQRDQTDLLYDIYDGYADMPGFAAYTRDTSDNNSFVQEIRLVSQGTSALSWIAGIYYSHDKTEVQNLEFTPGLTNFWYDPSFVNIFPELEYIAQSRSNDKESAIFGEAAYQVNDELIITLGARFFKYDLSNKSANYAPFYQGEIASDAELNFVNTAADDSGSLFKFNSSYQFSQDVMGYFTISEGFRLGGSNGQPLCDGTQQVCASKDELAYEPDRTTNYELGFKSTWMKNRLYFNAAIFNVDWKDAQVAAITAIGAENITTNAGSANSKGVEISTRALITDDISIYSSYAYAKAELTEEAPFLFGKFNKNDLTAPEQAFYDGADGDRLPGAPEQQFSFGLNYETGVFDDKILNINYGFTWQSDVITKVGLKADGETLPGFALSNISAKLTGDAWSATFYINNMFDKYAFTSVRRDKSWAGMARYDNKNADLPELQRVYGHYITKPLTIGIKYSYDFEI